MHLQIENEYSLNQQPDNLGTSSESNRHRMRLEHYSDREAGADLYQDVPPAL